MRVPEKLFVEPYHLRSLKLNGCTVVESCLHQKFSKGEMLVSEHLLLFVLQGTYTAKFGKQVLTIEKGEGLIVQRTHFVEYEKFSESNEKPYESLLFFLNDEIVKGFLAFQQPARLSNKKESPVVKIQFDNAVQSFLQTVLHSFGKEIAENPSFLQHKLFELLFNLSEINPGVIDLFTAFTTHRPTDLNKIMEENFKQNLTLEEFAYKAGRSLASFKRDFKKTYNSSPHQWLLSKRLDYAKRLLENNKLKIADACYDVGFESVAHFSRAFKAKFGVSPSTFKNEPIGQVN
jgi:AraC family transcriptional regulator, exoenzyme S synthesis regulatory protein ExsA